MTPLAQQYCWDAMYHLQHRHYGFARLALRRALPSVCHPRAFSKLMFAIRMCNKAIAAVQS